MNSFTFSDCKKAVNQATFRPTAERKAVAAKLLQEAMDFISNLEEVKEPSKKAKKKRRKAKRTAAQRTAASLKEMDEKKAVKKTAKLKAKQVASGVNEVDRVASLEAKIEALTAVLAVHMESTTLPSPSNEVSLNEVPFTL